MKNLVQSGLSNYNSLTAPHNNILKSIASKETSLGDLHIALKIIKTLPVIGKYQKDNLPNTKSLEGYSQQQTKTINELQRLSGNWCFLPLFASASNQSDLQQILLA